jgi:glucose-6-phosphate isomerase
MVRGETVNVSEKRAALHTAARSFADEPLHVAGTDIIPALREERIKIRRFTEKVHSGEVRGSTQRRFKDVVVVGIGGSYLGTQCVAQALQAHALPGMRLHFLANVDGHAFGRIAETIDPEAALWVVVSKSFTTAETMANAGLAKHFMQEKGLDAGQHLVTVTSKGSPGDDPATAKLASFHMFDFIGGRYSVTSAVGGVPLSLYLGYDGFERLLQGAQEMDRHACEAPARANLPLVAALLSVWNIGCLGYPACAIIPYAEPLARLAPHIQQLNMESNGKNVTVDGKPLSEPTGPIVFGEPGTNAQHSFFQLAHQGRPFPIEFIGVVRPQYRQYAHRSRGVTNHQELWANLLAQPMALALGSDTSDPARRFEGNRPSATLLLETLSPENVGRLLAFYEAKTVYEAFIWGINPFDQFGVELGKQIAGDIRSVIARCNDDPESALDECDPIVRSYLDKLLAGTL